MPTVWFCFQFLPARPPQIYRKNPPPPRDPGTNAIGHSLTSVFKRLAKMDWLGAILSTGCTTCLVVSHLASVWFQSDHLWQLGLLWGGVEKPWNSVGVIVVGPCWPNGLSEVSDRPTATLHVCCATRCVYPVGTAARRYRPHPSQTLQEPHHGWVFARWRLYEV